MKFKNKIEQQDTKEIVESSLINWDFFRNKTIMITGATGLIGSQLVKTFLYSNLYLGTNINIIALVRNKAKVKKLFPKSKNKELLKFIYQDISQKLKFNKKVDFIIHTANSTSSASFVEKPVETINSILQGTQNVLNYAKKANPTSIVYLSSMEVYGNIPLTREEALKEDDLGQIDILKPRTSYQEGKRAAECLCAAYAHEYGVPIKIARLAQTIGAGVDYKDNRVFAQFARNIVKKQDIILKTKGETTRSYCYITDVIVAILLMLEKGRNGESYNVANPETTCSIKDMAQMLCNKYTTSKLLIELEEDAQYLGTLKYYLDVEKLKNETGWSANVSLKEAFRRLINSYYTYETKKPKKIKQNPYMKLIKNKKNGYSFIENIFSIKNTAKHKIIRILGLNFKLNRPALLKKYYNLTIEENKIVFINFKGAGYGCNPKYIAEEIINRKLPYKLVWLAKSNIDKTQFPSEIKIVDFNSKKALKELATAKIWIDNQRKNFHIKRGLIKRQEQIYIQTWHGSLGIKKIGVDSPLTTSNSSWIPFGLKDAEMLDYLISNSHFENQVFENNFWNHGKKMLFGHPRNDVFFCNEIEKNKIKQKVCSKLNIETNKKIILYAPSYRDDGSIECYNLNANDILEAVCQKFNEPYVMAIRMHPHLKQYTKKLFDINENIINASYYQDIQELLIASDMVITDYSSLIFDFMLSRKPAFIYATDIEDFNTERGFYYPLESTPFPIATNNFELISNIKNFNKEKYKQEVEVFLQEKGCMEDGQASKRVVDLIETIMRR